MLAIDLSRDAYKFLEKLSPKHGRQIAEKLCQLQNDPEPADSKQLKGYSYWRADCG